MLNEFKTIPLCKAEAVEDAREQWLGRSVQSDAGGGAAATITFLFVRLGGGGSKSVDCLAVTWQSCPE